MSCRFFCLILSLFLVNGIKAQQPAAPGKSGFQGSFSGRVNGKVTSSDGKAVEYASVALVNLRDTSVVDGKLTNEKGKFDLETAKPGRYYLLVKSLGFADYKSEPLMLVPDKPEITDWVVVLKNSSLKLNELTVEENRSSFIQQADRKVFLVDKNMVSNGGNATDVLQQVPLINVDADGTVSLRGDENVTILIDGRPTLVNASNRTAFLQSIPASTIEKIEIITNPSSKFDAEGSTGMLNIVLKKNRKEALNGSVSAFWATLTKAGGNLTLGFKEKKAGFSMNYGTRYFPVWNKGWGYSLNNPQDSAVLVSQSSDGIQKPMNHNLKLALDLTPGKGWTAYVNVNGSYRDRYERAVNEYRYLSSDSFGTQIRDRRNMSTQLEWNTEASAGMEKRINKTHKINADFSYAYASKSEKFILLDHNSFYAEVASYGYNTYYLNPTTEKTTTAFGKMDYEFKPTETLKFEAGVKYGFRNPTGTFALDTGSAGTWQSDEFYSRQFDYREHISAQYVNFSGAWKKFSLQAGLRAEQTFIHARQTGSERIDFKRRYFQAFPSVFLTYAVTSKHSLGLSYAMRVNRPFVNSLIPLPDISDPQNIRKGNPDLKPETSHNLEMNYTFSQKQHFINVTGYYRFRLNQLNRFRVVDEIGTGYVTWVNYDRSESYGAELSVRTEILKNWEAFANFNVYGNRIRAGASLGNLNNRGVSFMMKANTSYKFPKIFTLQTSIFYQAPQPTAQGKIGYFFAWDAALKAEVIKSKFFITLSANDMLQTRRFVINNESANFSQYGERWRENRITTITLQYNFGKPMQGNKKRNRGEGDSGGMEDF